MKFDQRVTFLARVADGKVEGASVADRLRAVQLLGIYGLDSRTQGIDVSDVRDRLSMTLDIIRRALSRGDAERLIAAIRPVWRRAGQP